LNVNPSPPHTPPAPGPPPLLDGPGLADRRSADASIIFRPGAPPETFTFYRAAPAGQWTWPSGSNPQFTGHTWRFSAANDCAVELSPVAELSPLGDEGELQATPLDAQPPACDRLTVHPITWAYPPSLAADHPAAVEQLRWEYLAGQHGPPGGEAAFQRWLAGFGQFELWFRVHTDDMDRHWLNKLDGPGGVLFAFAEIRLRVPASALPRLIHYSADFHKGDTCRTIYLLNCERHTSKEHAP
jgi:hypothetical protein